MKFFDKFLKSENKKETKQQANLHPTASFSNSLSFPMPTVTLSSSLDVIWYNSLFSEEIVNIDEFSKMVADILMNVDRHTKKIGFAVTFLGKTYDVIGKIVSIQKAVDYTISLYLVDRTNERKLARDLDAERAVVCWILIDNYDDLIKNVIETSDNDKSSTISIISAIDQTVDEWAKILEATSIKPEKDRYYLIFKNIALQTQIAEKFEFLTKFSQINSERHLPVTISVGIGNSGVNLAESSNLADDALDMALGRGGDQTVVRNGDGFTYFGGRSIEKEKRTKVKLRLFADALVKLLPYAPNVFIMGHKNADIDSVGSAAGLCALMREKQLSVSIVLDEKSCVCKDFVEMLKSNDIYENIFISPAFAREIFREGDLLIVVDCHKAAIMEAPELLDKKPQLIVLDHHRREVGFVENTTLLYHEPYVSSTAEMVVEILQYVDSGVSLLKEEIQCLFAGMVLDTKNFQFKTGVRTFEAASYLRMKGVDTIAVKRLLQSDIDTISRKSYIISKATVYKNCIAISSYDNDSDNANLLGAQAADELLSISGISTSFVLCRKNNVIIISGRSLGDVNVQIILEKIGGGGHLTMAGAQLIDVDMEEGINKLYDAINEYFVES